MGFPRSNCSHSTLQRGHGSDSTELSHLGVRVVSTSNRILVIVPSGWSKIWDRHPELGPVPARDAYTGTPFRVNRRYAERFGDFWVILSAKYGFISPDFLIPGPYEVTFTQRSTGPISMERLWDQVREQRLGHGRLVVGLGGKAYRIAIERAFASYPASLAFPFAGLTLGKAMRATNRAVTTGTPGIDLVESADA